MWSSPGSEGQSPASEKVNTALRRRSQDKDLDGVDQQTIWTDPGARLSSGRRIWLPRRPERPSAEDQKTTRMRVAFGLTLTAWGLDPQPELLGQCKVGVGRANAYFLGD